MISIVVLVVLIVIAIGLLVAVFLLSNKSAKLKNLHEVSEKEIVRLLVEIERQKEKNEKLIKENSDLAIQNGIFKERIANSEQFLDKEQKRNKTALEEQKRYFADMMASVSDKVQVATEELLKKRQKEFEESSVTNLGQIVNPLKETIDNMKNAMADSAKEQTEMSSAMKENIRHVMEQTKATKSSADALA